MRLPLVGRAWRSLGWLGSILGPHGLMSALIALVAFAYGLGMLVREYLAPRETEREVLKRVLANWAQAPDYLGKNLYDYARDWSAALEAARPARLNRVRESLRRLGGALERHEAQFPLLNVVGLDLRPPGGASLADWSPRYAAWTPSTMDREILEVDGAGLELEARYQVAPEVDSVVEASERYYNRMIGALIGLSGASLLGFGYMVLHVLGLRERAAREAAREATLDLADRTCHELGNVAFVVANERRNLAGHLDLLERFIDEAPGARAAAAARAGFEPEALARLDHATAREYASRGIDPDFELRRSVATARDVCRQIAVCSDYITLTVRELDGFLKHSELPVELGPVVVAEVFDEAVALLAPRLEALGARVDRPGGGAPIRVRADRRLLAHALVNLVKNAVEAASATGVEPRVVLSARAEGGLVWLDVADNGPGIADAQRARIFDDGYSTKGPGRGKGLAIVVDSVRLQGGRLDLSTRPGASTFSIGLPAEPAGD